MTQTRARWIDVEGIGWICERPGRQWYAEHDGVRFVLNHRRRNQKDGCPDTGWYLFGPDDQVGEFMGRRFKDAARESFHTVSEGWVERLGGAS